MPLSPGADRLEFVVTGAGCAAGSNGLHTPLGQMHSPADIRVEVLMVEVVVGCRCHCHPLT